MHLMNSNTRGRARRGFTLVEVLIVMVLLGVVVGGLVRVLAGQQRFYRSASDLMDSRSQVRQAIFILPAELRGASISGGDILAANETMIDFRSTIMSSVVCAATANTITMPPMVLTSGQTLTAMRFSPAVNDIFAIYNDGPTTRANDDSWSYHNITNFAPVPGACPVGVPAAGLNSYVRAADVGQTAYIATINPGVPATIAVGAPVRVLRRMIYSLYAASDGQWYLGVQECTPGCSAPQPVSGPYRPFEGQGRSNGLSFAFFDENNAVLNPAAGGDLLRIARVQITVRGETQNPVSLPGMPAAKKSDSLTVQVGLRNRT